MANHNNPSALIRGGKFRTATYDACLDQDLVAQYEDLVQQRDRRIDETRDSLAGGKAPEFDAPLGELLERIQEATLTLKFQALPRPKFRELVDKYPARKDDDGNVAIVEDLIGVNFDEFFPALIPLSLVEPELSTEDLRVLLDERLDDRQYADLTDVVWLLNRQKVNLPFSSAASPMTPTSGQS